MSESKEPKVTECWVEEHAATGQPTLTGLYRDDCDWYRPAILMWKEDYDAMRKELEELRKYKQAREEHDAVSYAYHLLRQVKDGEITLEAQMAFLEKRHSELLDELQLLITEAHDDEEAK